MAANVFEVEWPDLANAVKDGPGLCYQDIVCRRLRGGSESAVRICGVIENGSRDLRRPCRLIFQPEEGLNGSPVLFVAESAPIQRESATVVQTGPYSSTSGERDKEDSSQTATPPPREKRLARNRSGPIREENPARR